MCYKFFYKSSTACILYSAIHVLVAYCTGRHKAMSTKPGATNLLLHTAPLGMSWEE
jgi:hypothetical protein